MTSLLVFGMDLSGSVLKEKADEQVCASAKADQDKDNAAVFRCLVDKAESTSAACSQETGRAVRNALQFYAPVSSTMSSTH